MRKHSTTKTFVDILLNRIAHICEKKREKQFSIWKQKSQWVNWKKHLDKLYPWHCDCWLNTATTIFHYLHQNGYISTDRSTVVESLCGMNKINGFQKWKKSTEILSKIRLRNDRIYRISFAPVFRIGIKRILLHTERWNMFAITHFSMKESKYSDAYFGNAFKSKYLYYEGYILYIIIFHSVSEKYLLRISILEDTFNDMNFLFRDNRNHIRNDYGKLMLSNSVWFTVIGDAWESTPSLCAAWDWTSTGRHCCSVVSCSVIWQKSVRPIHLIECILCQRQGTNFSSRICNYLITG